jgi:hypothetical protein
MTPDASRSELGDDADLAWPFPRLGSGTGRAAGRHLALLLAAGAFAAVVVNLFV